MAALFYIGIVVALIGGTWILIKAFEKNVWWGLGSLLLPLVSLVFVALHWKKTWRPFLVNVLGGLLIVLGFNDAMPDTQNILLMVEAQQKLTEQVQKGEISQQQARAELVRMIDAVRKGENYQPDNKPEETVDFDPVDYAPAELNEEEKAALQIKQAELEAKKKGLAIETHKRRQQSNQRYQQLQRKRHGYKTIGLENASKYLGEEVKVTTTKGTIRKGTLLDIKNDSLVLGTRSPEGTYSYNLMKKRISALEVYTRLKN